MGSWRVGGGPFVGLFGGVVGVTPPSAARRRRTSPSSAPAGRGLGRSGANRVLVYQYLVTLVGVASGVLILGEALTAGEVVGGVVIVLGVYLARRQ